MQAKHNAASQPPEPLPWPLTLAGLVAMAALYLTADRWIGLPVLATLLLAGRVMPWRPIRTRLIGIIARAALLSTIAAIVGIPSADISMWYMQPQYTNLLGFLLAGELAIRSWERVAAAPARESRGVVLFITALIITAASNTYDRAHMQILAPIYAAMVLLSLRMLARVEQTEHAASPTRRRASLVGLRAVAAIAALGYGLVVVYTITTFDYRLTSWAVDLLRRNRPPRHSEIGLSPIPRLQSRFNPSPSLDRVAVITGSRTQRHLRAAAFDTYQDRQWRPSLTDRTFVTLTASARASEDAPRPPSASTSVDAIPSPSPGTPGEAPKVPSPGTPGEAPQPPSPGNPGEGRGEGMQTLHFRLLDDTSNLLLLPLNTAALDAPAPLERDAFGAVRAQGITQYDAIVANNERHQGPLCLPPDAAQRDRALLIPPQIDPKVIELARAIVANEDDSFRRIIRIAGHLRSNHEYSLSYDFRTAEPLSDFILNRRAAHCQYFASAMVVMSRAVGVPARYVNGFYAHEPYGANGVVLRSRDAHAWAECFIDGLGWISIDATPSSGLPDALFPRPSRWRRCVEWLRDLPGRLRQWLASRPSRQALVALIALAAAGTLIVGTVRWLAARKRRLARQHDDAYATPSAELQQIARRFERLLRRRGVPCAANRTWREHLSSLDRARLVIDLDAGSRFLECYDAARFGGANGTALRRLHELIESLERRRPEPPHG
ncbi:transglutaminase domain-containing protein [Fontivita pretiosa]|uniref:transglutaminase family protein n=1 Tax=Fontivita pretiosa TaxID=2989684 RepID=UPI003D1672CD